MTTFVLLTFWTVFCFCMGALFENAMARRSLARHLERLRRR